MLYRLLTLVQLLLCCSLLHAAPQLKIKPDRASGIYAPSEKVTWSITAMDGAKPLMGEVTYQVKVGGLKVLSQGKLTLQDGKAEVTSTRAEPGTLLLVVTYKPTDGKKDVTSYGGAAFAPEKIQPSASAPEDFDDFWSKQIASMQKLPLNPTLERVDVGNPKIEYYRFTLDHINGTKVYGQLAKPVDGKNLPAMLQVQWAGVYPLDRSWVIQHAKNGWLAVNISAHNLPIAEKQEFYQEKAKTELDDYPGIGNESRETSYFLRMFLSCRRTVDYILTREDWNKKTLVVHGGSQGGYQAIVTAGLCPEVTAMSANVPAGCDHTGKAAGRETGWPQWASRTWKGRDEKKMLIAARYFDAMHFASRVKCPSQIALGLADTVCPAEGILATFNELKGPKELVVMPTADHAGDHAVYYQKFNAFLQKSK